jgi:dTDP-glucose 4,6-dehydratase
MLFVTGGAGFIGSNFIRRWLAEAKEPVVNIDALTYAGNPANLTGLDPALHTLAATDICDTGALKALFASHRPRAVVHFAAESHVDRSILGPEEFIRTNVLGTFSLLQASLQHWKTLDAADKASFRFLHVSTDEVFGSLGPNEPGFNENTAYAPNSPYSASKAGSDHLVRAYFHTYGLPTVTTNCSNNYGPYQFPEKLIPLMVLNALSGKPLPVYGDGQNIRDWLFVDDHCRAIGEVLLRGRLGETYNIGGNNEITNLEVVKEVCAILQRTVPRKGAAYESQITYVTDRPGHDRRYAIDATKIKKELGWSPRETFSSGLAKTIAWYVDNADWCKNITSGAYRHWINRNYKSRESHVEP